MKMKHHKQQIKPIRMLSPPNLQSLQLTSVVHENSNANNKSNSYSPKDKGLISIRNELAS